jgi:hypothetical protein
LIVPLLLSAANPGKPQLPKRLPTARRLRLGRKSARHRIMAAHNKVM